MNNQPTPRTVLCDDSGQGVVEYALILSLIVLAAVGALAQLTEPAKNPFAQITSFFTAFNSK